MRFATSLLVGSLAASFFGFDPAAAQPILLDTFASPHEVESGQFGSALSSVPDLNGDGFADFIVGAPLEGHEPGLENAGRAYVYCGATGELLHELRSPNEVEGGRFGYAVAGVPDADGDGHGDLLIGATFDGSEGARSGYGPGRAYLFSGATGELLHELVSPNEQGAGFFGWAVDGVPDADGDGYGDLLVSADNEHHSGRAYLFSGSTGALLHEFQPPPESSAWWFGHSVAAVPDTDGDGYGDVLVGAFYAGSHYAAGRVYLFSGATGELLTELASPNEQQVGGFGRSISCVATGNDSPCGALLFGTYGERRAYLFDRTSGTPLREIAAPDSLSDESFGMSVAGVPDVDGDDHGDVLVGAFSQPGSLGRVYLLSGATGVPLAELTSAVDQPQGYFGWALAGLPDTDGDGSGNILVGAPHESTGASPWRAGRVYLFSGVPKPVASEPSTAPIDGQLHLAGFPNPFSTSTTVTFTLPEPGPVRLAVYDILGREVIVLAEGEVPAGSHTERFHGDRLPRGLYLVRLSALGKTRALRVTLAR